MLVPRLSFDCNFLLILDTLGLAQCDVRRFTEPKDDGCQHFVLFFFFFTGRIFHQVIFKFLRQVLGELFAKKQILSGGGEGRGEGISIKELSA